MKHITISFIKKNLPKRSRSSSKIDGGSVLIVGGSKGFFGAGILAALAATRSGAGYTHLMTAIDKFPWLNYPDFIVHPYKISVYKKHINSAIGIGPGMGTENSKKRFLKFLIDNNFSKVVVDGDALTILSKMVVKELPVSWILTPHEGELARLLGISSSIVKKNRLHSVKLAHEKYGCVIVLKGAETLIADSHGIFQVNSGTRALAKAGSGDVLLGVITALYAQGLSPVYSAITGCFIHGFASQLWLKEKKDFLSMRPIDIIDKLPSAIFKIRASSAKK